MLKKKYTQLATILNTLDDLCYGTKNGRIKRQSLIKSLEIAFSTDQAKSITAHKKVEEALNVDVELPKIKRTFPKFSGKPEMIGSIFRSAPTLWGLLLSVLYLSDMQKDEEFATDISDLGTTITSLKLLKSLNLCIEKINAGDSILPKYFSEFQTLRNVANEFSLSGSLINLPNVTVGLTEKSKDFREIVTAIKKFPVLEELQKSQRECKLTLSKLLLDVLDVFKDYSIGEVRKKALNDFPKLCLKYAELPY